jgi:hypothetical protein
VEKISPAKKFPRYLGNQKNFPGSINSSPGISSQLSSVFTEKYL